MKVKLSTRGLIIIFMVWGAVVATAQNTLSQQRASGTFSCGQDNGRPATIVQHPQRGNVTLILWTSDYFRGSGWDNQRRCEQVSSKFQQNQTRNVLKAIVSGTYNNLPVLCAFPGDEIPSQVIPCQDERVLMTLRPGDDSQASIQQLIGLNGNITASALVNGGALVSSPNNSRLQGIDMYKWVQNSPNTSNLGNCNKLFGTCP